MDPRTVELNERKAELQSLLVRGSEALAYEHHSQSHMAMKIFGEVMEMLNKFHLEVSVVTLSS